MKREEAVEAIGEWMRTNPKVKQANHTLVALLQAARGTITEEDNDQMTYVFQLRNSEAPELSGTYEVSIKKMED